MSKVCTKCGTVLDENALFCEECGERVAVPAAQTVNSTGTGGAPINADRHSGLGIASFVLGIISILSMGMFFIPEIVGLALGIAAMMDKKHKKTFGVVGVVLSAASIAFLIFALLIYGLTEA